MLIIMMLTTSFAFMWMKHPISMGLTIILQTLMVSMMTGLMLGSFWFSYIIMIMMLSGMLVLFIYMASVASNEKFHMSIKLIVISITMMIMSSYMQIYMDNNDDQLLNINTTLSMEYMSLNNLFNCKFKLLTIMLVLYLLLTMITVSQIVNISEGPLRMFKK
uniref:NADH-ubiquinone oxidoreductase chain 6 n=1 Tax=Enoplops sibiricus TaxID=2813412 RepID=A0A8T9ZXE2_9HEMI|nr:NADH dehydrogenase subunit 6 [Enoplops sibiricus]